MSVYTAPPKLLADLTALGVRLIDYSAWQVVVRCPLCGGRRTVSRGAVKNWTKLGAVSKCNAARNLNGRCRPG